MGDVEPLIPLLLSDTRTTLERRRRLVHLADQLLAQADPTLNNTKILKDSPELENLRQWLNNQEANIFKDLK